MTEIRRLDGMVFCTGFDDQGRQWWLLISESTFSRWAKEGTR